MVLEEVGQDVPAFVLVDLWTSCSVLIVAMVLTPEFIRLAVEGMSDFHRFYKFCEHCVRGRVLVCLACIRP
jgi:hypothetical protein